MNDDAELLRRYAKDRSEAAFTELVQRHLNLVYFAALRRVGGDAHRAQDVASQVFTALARQAAALSRHTVLTGWLYTTTRNVAFKAARTERRRQTREQEAHTMQQLSVSSTPEPDWEQLRPVIDHALDELNETDRQAILLRFLQNRPFADVGTALRLTEDAARMRVDRALDKLRTLLARRGITSSAAALAVMLANQAAAVPPAGLAASVTALSLAGAAAAGTTTTLTSMNVISLTKMIAAVAAITVGTVGFWWQHQTNVELQREVAALSDQNADLLRARQQNAAGLPTPAPTAAARPPPADTSSAAPAAPAPAGLVPVETFVNAGRATPRATFETSYWARKHINLPVLADALAFDPAGKAKAESLFALLSDELRSEYGTPENFAAAMLADLPCPAAIAVDDEVQKGPDDVDLKIRSENAAGKVSVRTLPYHHYADGWRAVIPASLVDLAAKEITKNPKLIPQPQTTASPK